jgi:hypothetical protein
LAAYFPPFSSNLKTLKSCPFPDELHYRNSFHCVYTLYFGKCSTTSGNFWHTNCIHTITNKHTTYSIYVTNSTVSAVSMIIRTPLKSGVGLAYIQDNHPAAQTNFPLVPVLIRPSLPTPMPYMAHYIIGLHNSSKLHVQYPYRKRETSTFSIHFLNTEQKI